MATAYALALMAPGSEELTSVGRRLALASDAERRALVREAVRGFEPYGRLLEAILAPGGRERTDTPIGTETGWVEMWWGTHGYGSSQSNRGEGAATLARLLEYAGLAKYVQGRRGHASRIEWEPGAAALLRGPSAAPHRPRVPPAGREGQEAAPTTAPPRSAPPHDTIAASTATAPPSELTVELGPGRIARLQLPAALTAEEKSRLLALVDLLVRVDPTSPTLS